MPPSSGYNLFLRTTKCRRRAKEVQKLGEIWRTLTGQTKLGTGMGLHMMGLKTEGLKRICIIIG